MNRNEFLYLYCPIWIMLGALFLHQISGEYQTWVLAGMLFLLAEPHFAVTVPLVNFNNKEKFRCSFLGEEYGWSTLFVRLPLFLILIFLSLAFFSFEVAILLFFCVNFFHVNRQSVGVVKLAIKRNTTLEPSFREELFIWIPSSLAIISFTTGMFDLPVPNQFATTLFIAFAIFLVLTSLWYVWYKRCHLAVVFANLTGALMWSPGFFIKEPLPVLVLGISMHYAQYLYLSYRVIKGQKADPNFQLQRSPILIGLWLILASSALTYAAINDLDHKLFILLPMCFQLYHFIVDAFLWRGSSQEVRSNILRHIF